MHEPIKIENKNKLYGSMEPIKNASFISPPPKASCLNARYPNNLNKYATPNITKP